VAQTFCTGETLEDVGGGDTGWLKTVRTKLKIQKVATLVLANHSHMIDEIAAAGISHHTCHKILT
jgi:hypothetical protein